MLRVKIEVDEKYIHRFDGIFQVKNLLLEQGILIDREVSNPDILWIQDGVLKQKERTLGTYESIPLIIYERSDAASLGINSSFIRRPNVLAYTKEINFRDNNFHNQPHVSSRWYYRLINADPVRYPEEPPAKQFSESELAKIVCIHPIYRQGRFDEVRALRLGSFHKRWSDIFFAGTMKYDIEHVVNHRKKACEALAKLGGNHNVLMGMGRCLEPRAFYAALRGAKMFLSPYGYGEYSWKDYETIFAGCILIKPNSDFVVSYGFDTYTHGKHYLRCNPDFSDLPAIVDDVLNNLNHYTDMADAARTQLYAAFNDNEKLANDLAAFLNGLFAERLPPDRAAQT